MIRRLLTMPAPLHILLNVCVVGVVLAIALTEILEPVWAGGIAGVFLLGLAFLVGRASVPDNDRSQT